MNHALGDHPSSEILALHAGGDLPTVEAPTVAEHLASCELCRAELNEIAFSMETFRALAAAPAAAEIQALQDSVRRRTSHWGVSWGRTAAAAAIVILAGAGALTLRHRPEPTPEVTAHVVPAQQRGLSPAVHSPLPAAHRRAAGPEAPPPGRMASVKRTLSASQAAPALRLQEVSRKTETGEPAELRLASTDLRVVVLWQMSDVNEGNEGNNRQ